MEIPRLLPDEIIEAIKKKAASNRANASYSKHDYLLSKKVYCEQCGVSFYAHSPNGYKYYRHPKTDKCTNLGSVDARELEPAVLLNLFNMYGDEEYLKKAMERAIPNKKKIAKLRKERESLDKKHKRIESKIDNVVEAIAVGVISKDHVRKKMKGYQEQLDLIDERIEHIDLELENTPTEDQIDKDAKLLYEIHREIANLPERLHKMSFDDKRKIVENSFTGKDHRGRRLGVYVKKDDSKKDIIFIIRGAWDGFEIEEQLPLAKEEYEDLLCWPTNRSYDVDEEIKNFKSNLNSRFG